MNKQQKPKRLSELCKESPEFKTVLYAVLRGEAKYCSKTGKVSWVVDRKPARFKTFN